MPEDKNKNSKWSYYSGHTHFSYDNNLAYHARPYMGSSTVEDMVKKAEQCMADNQFKG